MKILIFILYGLFILPATQIHAETSDSVVIKDNGTGSRSSINVSDTSSTSNVQNNEATLDTSVTNGAHTGGNTSNGNQAGPNIKTGDATNVVRITNSVNTNTAESACCTTPSPDPSRSPTPVPPSDPSPSPQSAVGSVNATNNADGTDSSSDPSGEQGMVLGISAASGNQEDVFVSMGFLTILTGIFFKLRKAGHIS